MFVLSFPASLSLVKEVRRRAVHDSAEGFSISSSDLKDHEYQRIIELSTFYRFILVLVVVSFDHGFLRVCSLLHGLRLGMPLWLPPSALSLSCPPNLVMLTVLCGFVYDVSFLWMNHRFLGWFLGVPVFQRLSETQHDDPWIRATKDFQWNIAGGVLWGWHHLWAGVGNRQPRSPHNQINLTKCFFGMSILEHSILQTFFCWFLPVSFKRSFAG